MVETFFIYLQAIFMFLLVNYLLRLFAFLLVIYKSSLYFKDDNTVSFI